MKNELEHEPEPEIVKVKEAKTAVVDEVDAPSDAHAPGTPEKSIKSPPAMYWQRVRETHKMMMPCHLPHTCSDYTHSSPLLIEITVCIFGSLRKQLEERYGKKVVKNLAMTNNEGTPSYISSALF